MTGHLQITILGCGSSGGVPRVGGDWGRCDPNEPKNKRTRCSLLVDYWNGEGVDRPPADQRTTVIIDTSPDLREQLLKAGTQRLDALLFTHEHADQTHGIDDLRAIAYRMRERIPTYMNAHTRAHLMERFGYCFEMPEGRVHPPILDLQDDILANQQVQITGPGGVLDIDVFELSHGPTPVLGFRFDDRVIYTPDVYDIDEATLAALTGAEVWIVDTLRYNPSPTHAHCDKAFSWLARTKTRKAIFTNMHLDLDYATFQNELYGPHDVAYDGMTVYV